MSFEDALLLYREELKAYDAKTFNEHTFRTQLENLLTATCDDISPLVKPRQEVSAKDTKLGTPDYSMVHTKNLGTVGLVETKKIGTDLSKLHLSDQIKKYRKRCDNILLTNYLEFVVIRNGNVLRAVALLPVSHLKSDEQPKVQIVKELRSLFEAYLSDEPKGIATTKELAEQLAMRCHDVRDLLTKRLRSTSKSDSHLSSLYDAFRQFVDTNLGKEDFADAFSQTLGYSLFIAKLNNDSPEPIDLYNIQKFIPDNFTFIHALSDFLKELQRPDYMSVKHRVEEIIGMMNHLHLESILKELAGQAHLDLGESDPMISRDPFIYFYEHFLREYDADKKRERGVFYTPPSVVHFIVRTINEILIDQFGIERGLSDHEQVEVLDFATGTGTFLHEAFWQVLEMEHVRASPALREKLVEEHLLQNFYGFEYLIAPYAIAHMKLAQFLRERQLHSKPKLKVLLTNTLDNSEQDKKAKHFPFVEWLKREGDLANDIKARPIRVIMGNPPYSGASKNKGPFDDVLKKAYAPSGETKMNWDDYEKFICFAHQKMKAIDRGVIGVITNNNFLNAVTKRQMRNALMRDFDRIYILNLHGKQGEMLDTGEADRNVFDITVGVAITFLVKTGENKDGCDVFYGSLRSSSQKDKWRQVLEFGLAELKSFDVTGFNSKFAMTRWRSVFDQDLSIFIPSSEDVSEQLQRYGDFLGLKDIFHQVGSGIQTDRDKLVIDTNKSSLASRMKIAFDGTFDETFKAEFRIQDSSSYGLLARLTSQSFDSKSISKISYRPFDQRHIYYKVGFTSRPAFEIMKHMLQEENLAIMTCRLLSTGDWRHIFATSHLAERASVSINSREASYLIPLYLNQSGASETELAFESERKENLKSEFRKYLEDRYGKRYSPELVIGYVYAVLHSRTYRERYNELLKLDFPRVPFVKDRKAFECLAEHGRELIQVHVMRTQVHELDVPLKGAGDCVVAKVEYFPQTQRLHINDTQYFDNVPPEAWAFKIGSYDVLEKYLSERKGITRSLTLDEIQHVPKIVNILVWTVKQMDKIEQNFCCP